LWAGENSGNIALSKRRIDKMDSTSGAGGVSVGAPGSGNQALQASFAEAQREAQQTLSVSVIGQAQLNALRARPQ
jgi:hypothetical protein